MIYSETNCRGRNVKNKARKEFLVLIFLRRRRIEMNFKLKSIAELFSKAEKKNHEKSIKHAKNKQHRKIIAVCITGFVCCCVFEMLREVIDQIRAAVSESIGGEKEKGSSDSSTYVCIISNLNAQLRCKLNAYHKDLNYL